MPKASLSSVWQLGIKQAPKRAHLLVTTALVAGMSVAGAAGAETVTWDGSKDNDWGDKNNWTAPAPPNKTPVAGDAAVINNGALANQPTLSTVTPALLSTTVSAGTLTISTTGSLISTNVALSGSGAILNQGNITGAISVTGGTLTNDGGTLVAASGISVSGTGALIMTGTGSATGDVSVAGTGNLEIGATSTITGNVAIAEDGTASNAGTITGTLSVNGGTFDNAGAVTGATTVTDGVLNLNTDSDLSDTEALTVDGGTVNVNAADSVGTLSGTGGTLNFDTDGRLNTNVTGDVTFAGDMTGSKALDAIYFEKLGAEILTLSGTNTVDGGRFEITDGTVRVSGGNAIGDNNVVGIGTATLELLSDETIGALADLSTATINLNANTLTFAGVGVAIGSTVAGTINGTGNLTYNAPDLTTTFTGALNYTGTTTVTGGEFQLGASDIMADASSLVVNGGTLNLQTFNETVSAVTLSSGSITGTGTLTSASTFDVQSGTVSAVLGGAVGLVKTGAGTVTLSGANTYTGLTQVNGGTLVVANADALGAQFEVNGASSVMDLNGGAVTVFSGIVQSGGTLSNGTMTLTAVSPAAMQMSGGTISANLAGDGGLTSSFGTNILTGTNTYAGATTITGGTLQIGAGGATGTLGAGAVINNSALVFDRNNALTVANVISGSGTVTQAGTGTTTLSGTNSYGGVTTVSGGTLDITGSITGNVIVENAGRLRISNSAAIGGSITTTGSVVSYANGVVEDSDLIISSATTQLEVLGADAAEQSGVISGTNANFGFEKIGTGSLTLSTANTYTGETTVTAGTLNVTGSIGSASVVVEDTASLVADGASLANTAAVTLNDSGNLTVNTAVETIGSLATDAASTVVLNAGLIVGDATDTAVAGVISGAGGITKTGSGTLALTGTNTYSGLTLLEEGTVSIDNDAALGTGNLTLSGGTLLATADASLTKNIVTFEESSGLAASSGQTLSITASSINPAPFADKTITFGSASQTGIVELGVTDILVANATIVTADIVGGTLRIGNDFAATSLLGFAFDATQIGAGGTLDINGFTTTVRNLTGAGAVTNDGGAAATLRLTGTSNFGGVIQDGTSATGLQVIDGTTSLTGANTYTGATTLSGGNLTLSGGGSLTSTAVAIDATRVLTTQGGLATGTALVNNGSLVLTGSDEIGSIAGTGGVNLNANTLTTGGLDTSTALSGVVSGSGSLVKVGTGTQTLSGNNTATNLTVQDGTLLLSGNNSGVSTVTVGGGTGDARLRVEGAASLVGGQQITTLGSVVSYGDGVFMGSAIVLNSNDTQLEVLAGDSATQLGPISETGGVRPLEKIGAGTLDLAVANTYTGTTTVTAGTLNVSGSIASSAVVVRTAGSLGVDGASLLDTASVTLNGSGVMNLTGSETIGSLTGAAGSSVVLGANRLTFGNATNTTMAGVISGIGGALTKNGSGTTILSNTNTYSGDTTVNAGVLDITGSVASAAININGTGSVQVDGASLSDTATVTLAGSGDLTLTGNETIGALSSLSANSTVDLNGNALSVTTNADQTFAGVISGTPASVVSLSLSKSGAGNLLLTGQNTFTGQLVLYDGTVTLNNAGGNALADTVLVNSVAGTTLALQTNETIGILNGGAAVTLGTNTLTFNGTPGFFAVQTGVISGSGGVTNAGAFQRLSGTNTYTGTTTVTSGHLTLVNGTAIVDSGAVVVSGGTLALAASETIGSLAGSGGTVSLDTHTLTTGNAANTAYAGQITGTGALVKEGTGTFTLSGANSYTGSTTINNGALTLAGAGSLASTNVSIGANTLNSDGGGLATGTTLTSAGGTLALSGNETIASYNGTGAITIAGQSNALTLNNGVSAVDAVISGAGGLTVTGTSDTTLTAANTYTGGTIISGGGHLTVSGAGTLGAVTGSTMISGGILTINTDVTQYNVTQSGGVINGTNTLTATNQFTHLNLIVNSDVQTPVFSMQGGEISSTGSVTASNRSEINGTSAINGTLDGAGTGAATVQTGTTTLGATGAITNMVAVNVDAGAALTTGGTQQIDDAAIVTVDGTLNLGGDETFSGLNGSATGQVNNGGNLLTLGTSGGSFAGAINGAGGLIVTGGTQTLTRANGYTGATDVNGGTLSVTGTGTLASTDLETAAGATLSTDGGALQTSAVIANAGMLTVTGNEEVARVSGAGGISLAGGDLTLNAGTSTISGVISGTNGLSITGSSATTLSGVNTYAGNTTVGSALTVTSTGRIAGATTVSASGTMTNAGGVRAIANAGTLTNSGTAGAVINTGTGTNTGTIASLGQQAGSFANSGTVSGNAAVTGGTLNHSGTVGGNLTVASGSTANINAGTVDGNTTNNGGIVNIDGGTFTGTVSNAAGTLTAAGTVSGFIENAATMTVTSPDTLDLTGTIINTGTGLFTTNGTVATSGGLTNAGTVNAEGALNSAVINNATFNVTGPLTATGEDFANTAILAIGANSYTGIGTLTNSSGAVVDLSSGGNLGVATLTNNGIVNANDASVSGAITNNLTFNARRADLSGSVSNSSTGVFDLTGGAVTGPVNNAGTFILTNGAVSGVFTNSGTVTALGNTSMGGYVGTGSGLVSMLTPSGGGKPTADRLTINGDVNGGVYAMDLNIGTEKAVDNSNNPINPDGGTSDKITVTGNISGALHFDFINKSPAGIGPFLGDAVLVLDGANASDTYSITHSGLGAGGAVVYSLAQIGDDLRIVSETSAGIGGVAANASLVQSLIGTVVNRPTSPFVSGLATEEGCSRGGYLRGTYGVSTVSGTSNNSISTSNSSVKASYAGAQGGYDYGCNDGRFFDGWDGSFGAMVGYNTGKSDQNVEVGVSGGGTGVASITHSKFDQAYIGAYTAFAKDRITTDVQVRYEKTNFELNETVLPGFFGLGLADAKFSTNSTNITGRFSYRMDLNDGGLNFVPTAGLSYTRTSGATVNFTGGESLRLEAFDSIVGFVGGTVAKTKIAPEGNAGTTYFGSANYYHDFAGDRKSVFTDALGGTQNITTKNIGGFGELSMGVNYVRILENGPAGAKQLNANVRLDTRFGSNVKKSASVTAQVRLSF